MDLKVTNILKTKVYEDHYSDEDHPEPVKVNIGNSRQSSNSPPQHLAKSLEMPSSNK